MFWFSSWWRGSQSAGILAVCLREAGGCLAGQQAPSSTRQYPASPDTRSLALQGPYLWVSSSPIAYFPPASGNMTALCSHHVPVLSDLFIWLTTFYVVAILHIKSSLFKFLARLMSPDRTQGSSGLQPLPAARTALCGLTGFL